MLTLGCVSLAFSYLYTGNAPCGWWCFSSEASSPDPATGLFRGLPLVPCCNQSEIALCSYYRLRKEKTHKPLLTSELTLEAFILYKLMEKCRPSRHGLLCVDGRPGPAPPSLPCEGCHQQVLSACATLANPSELASAASENRVVSLVIFLPLWL